jgi:hypothetical protein
MVIKQNRSTSYIGTVDFSDPDDMNLIRMLRKMVREANRMKSYGPKSMYVKLQGRGPRLGVSRYNQSLPLSFAKMADVYLYGR